MPLVLSASPLSVATGSSGLPLTTLSVSERMAPPTSRSRLLLISGLPQMLTSGVRPTVTKPPPPTLSLSSQNPPPPSSPSLAKTFPTSRDQRSRRHPRVDMSFTRKRVRASPLSVAGAKSLSPSRLLRNSRRRVSRPGLSLFRHGRSLTGRRRATS